MGIRQTQKHKQWHLFKELPEKKTLNELEHLETDWLVNHYKTKSTLHWKEEYITKEVCRPNLKTDLQIEHSDWVLLDFIALL